MRVAVKTRTLLSSFVFLLSAPLAFAQNSPATPPMMSGQMQNGQMMSSGAASPGMHSPADQKFMDGMTKMNEGMSRAPMTGNADKDFVAMMISHHQGAIDMARVELEYGKDAQMRKLAKGIITAQEREIAQMEAWAAKHDAK